MAFDDWPTTEGYFIFFYPLDRWFGNGWNPFIEHSHRVLGGVVGLLTIALAVVIWRTDRRKWLVYLGLFAVVAVAFQGTLGGFRVIENRRTLAMVHGCMAPLFFGLCGALAVFTSRRWCRGIPPQENDGASKLQRLAVITTALVYLQIVLGAWVRHVPSTVGSGTFRLAVLFHLLLAAALAIHVLLLAIRAWRRHREQPAVLAPITALVGLLLIQLALGGGTWVANYGWPEWFAGNEFAQRFLLVEGSSAQTLVTTAHVVVGSLIFVTAMASVLWSLRLYRRLPPSVAVEVRSRSLVMETAE